MPRISHLGIHQLLARVVPIPMHTRLKNSPGGKIDGVLCVMKHIHCAS